MSHATTPTKGPSTADCEVLTDIHTQSNLAEIEIVSLVRDIIPRYRLRVETDFACSNEDFIQTPRIDGSEFEGLTNPQIRALLDYYVSSSGRISQMTKTYHDISAVTRLLEDRENDLQMAASLGHTLLESNDALRSQISLLEQDIEQTTEIVKQLKYDLLLKERLIRFYSDMELDLSPSDNGQLDIRHFEQKIRNLEYENRELRAETIQLKIDAETLEHQEQSLVDNCVNALANANGEVDQLQQELVKKTDENTKQQDEISRLSYEMREVRRRLSELKKENDELKVLLTITGKNRQEHLIKIHELEKNYAECLDKLHKSQGEVNSLQKKLLHNSPSTPTSDNIDNRHTTIFLSPVEYANFMGLENSLKSELEEILEDPNQLCSCSNDGAMTKIDDELPVQKCYRRRVKRGQSDTDGESSMNDSAFSDNESLSSASSCRLRQQSSPPFSSTIAESKLTSSVSSTTMTTTTDRRLPSGISSRLRLVKRLEGSNMLKRWQELAEPSLSSCLHSIPGVYTRAEILHGVKEEDEDPSSFSTPHNELEQNENDSSSETPIPPHPSSHRINLLELLTQQGLTARTLDYSRNADEFEKAFLTSPLPTRVNPRSNPIALDPDESDDDEEPTTPPSSPTYGAHLQTSAVLHQVMQRLVGISLRSFETLTNSLTSPSDHEDEEKIPKIDESSERLRTTITTTPPSSPTFTGLTAPTPNTAIRAIKTSTFMRVSSLNPFTSKSIREAFAAARSPGEVPSTVVDLVRNCHFRT